MGEIRRILLGNATLGEKGLEGDAAFLKIDWLGLRFSEDTVIREYNRHCIW